MRVRVNKLRPILADDDQVPHRAQVRAERGDGLAIFADRERHVGLAARPDRPFGVQRNREAVDGLGPVRIDHQRRRGPGRFAPPDRRHFYRHHLLGRALGHKVKVERVVALGGEGHRRCERTIGPPGRVLVREPREVLAHGQQVQRLFVRDVQVFDGRSRGVFECENHHRGLARADGLAAINGNGDRVGDGGRRSAVRAAPAAVPLCRCGPRDGRKR